MMNRSLLRSLAAATLGCGLSTLVSAGGARFWEVATLGDFLKGDATHLAIDQHGRLTLGPALTELADTSLPHLWTVVPERNGSLLVGSGNLGQVLRIAPDGTRSVVFDAAELEAHALALGPDGTIYVGTSPDGRVYRVSPSGESRELFDPEDKYIWDLTVDAEGTVFVATGDKGRIYRIGADGEGRVFYDTKATHVRALARAASGDLLAGTESPGRVFGIDGEGRGFLLLDAGLPEVSSLRVADDGVLYATAVGSASAQETPPAPAPSEPARVPIPSVSTEITGMSIVDVTAASGRPPGGAPRKAGRSSGRGAVFRIRPDGVWDQIWTSGDDAPYAVMPEPQGSLLVATGAKGKIYRITGQPALTTLVARVPAQQVTAMLRDGEGRLLLASANPGKIFRLTAAPAEQGTYESDILDTESVSTWGTVSWRGQAPRDTRVRLFTRSGNTAAPDETWSRWSDPYSRADGQQITSPKARYLQWKLEAAGTRTQSPVITSVTVAYLQRNQRPAITDITVHPPGVVFQKPFSTGETEIAGYDADPVNGGAMGFTASQVSAAAGVMMQGPALGRRGYQKGLQTFIWKAEDGNEDDLSFELFYRREGETAWKALKRGLIEPIFVWDTTSVPNGTYVVKVVASDGPANPPGEALAAEQESAAFDIDNAPPRITVDGLSEKDGSTVVTFTVTDEDSPVQRVEYSIDADRWRPIYPRDGIADSRREEFELRLNGATEGKAIVLRAVDALNNVATARADSPDVKR